jgi:hypothetical protein
MTDKPNTDKGPPEIIANTNMPDDLDLHNLLLPRS